ncbi:MAG TPA: four helix bundle protein [Saprospiraceae bacterium]|nr:four helix bundle protein [Saprospiraceae bacterium]
MATYTTFEQLPCWQKCQTIKLWLLEIVKRFPEYEKYELTFSIRKCIRSATRNLAEGFGKFTIPDKVNFCRTSKGSLYELTDDLITAVEEGYISSDLYRYGRSLIEEAIASINGYISYLNSRRDGDWEPR